MASYSLSDEAEEDLDRLYEYGILNFGLPKADAYFDELLARFQEIAATPFIYPAVDHVRKGYRMSVYGVNAIYYQASDDGSVFVVRILGQQNRELLDR